MAHDSEADDLGAIDKLLAETDHGWDAEAQVLTLKQAAATKPLAEQRSGALRFATGDRKGLSIPIPRELAPAESPSMSSGAPATEDSATLRARTGTRAAKPPPPRRKGPPPLPPASAHAVAAQPPAARTREAAQGEPLIDLLCARVSTLETQDDPVGLARAHMELAVAHEVLLGDDARAGVHAQSALDVSPASTAAHSWLRRTKHGRSALPEMLVHLEHELLAATSDEHKAVLLSEKARLLGASGDRPRDVRSTWQRALAHVPSHPGALKGLEADLVANAQARGAPADWEDWELLSAHLATMSEAYSSDARLAAWLQVERARILERKLGRLDAARGALEQAVILDPRIGPVRTALVRHVAAHADWGALAALLEEEARIEDDSARSARLELDAAQIAAARLSDRPKAVAWLERAAARAPTEAALDRRVLDELVRLREADGQWADAARARRARLAFITEPAVLGHELRVLAEAAQRSGDLDVAVSDTERAMAVDPTDPTLPDALDGLWKAAQKHEQRVAMWLHEAARREGAEARAQALIRAAAICDELGRHADSVRHLRSAWVAAPGNGEVLDALARQLAPKGPDTTETGPRALVDLYAQAAESAADVGRKIAFYERVALLWEEVLGDPKRAARAYEQLLELDPNRRSALLGLERTAAKMGDSAALARALLEEARLSADGRARLALRVRAANALAEADPPRAVQLVREVLGQDANDPSARALETHLEQRAGRWETAAASVLARIDIAATPAERVALWLELARILSVKLHKPADAMAAFERAWMLDPAHPVPPAEIARMTEDLGDWRGLRDAVERMSGRATTAEDRARHLVHAAEIEELRLRDDAAAIRTLQRALGENPSDELAGERLARALARHALSPGGDDSSALTSLLAKRIERATSPEAARRTSFEMAALLLDAGREAGRAASMLEGALAEHPDEAPVLRTLESLRRRSGEPMALARVLDKQGQQLGDPKARLGALWNLVALEEWALPVGNPVATYRRILDLDPTDVCALEALLRHDLGGARTGDPRATRSAAASLRAMVKLVSDSETRLTLLVFLSLMLERSAGQAAESRVSDELAREALGYYRDALRIDELSVTAATGVARLAERFHDVEASVAAARSLSNLTVDPRVRARYLVEAGELLLGGDDDDRLGSWTERRKLAAATLERALESDANSMAAATRLAAVLLEERLGERLVSTFLAALGRTTSPETAVTLGTEIARVAREELRDLTVAIDAMRRVRAAAPKHIPSLLTLAELCIEQRAWPEAVDALEAVASSAQEVQHKLTALFALASIYEKVLGRQTEVDRVLRAAVALDPSNVRALGALLRRAAADTTEADGATALARRNEVVDLLERLAGLEQGAEQRTLLLMDLAEAQRRRGDAKAAERAMIDAVATSPSNAHAFARLASLFRRSGNADDVGYARALGAVIRLGQQRGAVDARWFAALGLLETLSLGQAREGIGHLQRAVSIDPTLYETRFELARAHEHMGAHEEAARVVVGMLSPESRPLLSIADPLAALALLERTFSASGRADQAVVASELRAIGGDLDTAYRDRLRARRLPPLEPQHGVLDRSTLVTQVAPVEARHVLLDVAGAIAGVEAKILRADLAEMGITSRDRITPRDRNPMRALFDRLARQLGVSDVELAISPGVLRTRVLAQDSPWIVVPEALAHAPEPARAASLARALARIALGAPWLDELSAAHVEALLVAAARQVAPTYGVVDDPDGSAPTLAARYGASLARTLSRRQRRLLEDLVPRMASQPLPPAPAEAFVEAVRRAEVRAAFLATGDLLATIDDLRSHDASLPQATESAGPPALIATLNHPRAGDLARFALTAEATALRQRLGATWVAA